MRIRRTDASDAPPNGEGTTEASGAVGQDEAAARKGTTPRKDRPTPTKAEAAALHAQPLVVNDRKVAKQRARASRDKQWALQQQAMKTGDERYLPVRDRGKSKRAARDWVDSRFLPSQLFLPGAFAILVLMLLVGQFFPGQEGLVVVAMYALLLIVILTSVIAVQVMKRELVRELGAQYQKGTGRYALMRAMYPRFLRQPKPQVAVGGGPVTPRGERKNK